MAPIRFNTGWSRRGSFQPEGAGLHAVEIAHERLNLALIHRAILVDRLLPPGAPEILITSSNGDNTGSPAATLRLEIGARLFFLT